MQHKRSFNGEVAQGSRASAPPGGAPPALHRGWLDAFCGSASKRKLLRHQSLEETQQLCLWRNCRIISFSRKLEFAKLPTGRTCPRQRFPATAGPEGLEERSSALADTMDAMIQVPPPHAPPPSRVCFKPYVKTTDSGFCNFPIINSILDCNCKLSSCRGQTQSAAVCVSVAR